MADIASALKQWSTTNGNNNPTSSTTLGTGLAPNLQQIQATLRNELATRSLAITATATTDIGVKDEGIVLVSNVTGTVAIASFGTVSAGMQKLVTFSITGGSLTLTYNPTTLILPAQANIIVADGDSLLTESLGSGNWKVHAYYKASGLSGFAASGANADINSLNVLNAINTNVNVNTSNSQSSIGINDAGGSGANLRLVGNGATTPNKHIRSWSGALQVINSAYTTAILNLTDAGALSVAGGITAATQAANNNSTQVATTAYVDFQDIGVGQTWQNVTGSRATGSTYFNMTGRTIVVQAYSSAANANAAIQLTVSGAVVAYNAFALGTGSAAAFVTAIVPPGASYIRIDTSVAATQFELR